MPVEITSGSNTSRVQELMRPIKGKSFYGAACKRMSEFKLSFGIHKDCNSIHRF